MGILSIQKSKSKYAVSILSTWYMSCANSKTWNTFCPGRIQKSKTKFAVRNHVQSGVDIIMIEAPDAYSVSDAGRLKFSNSINAGNELGCLQGCILGLNHSQQHYGKKPFFFQRRFAQAVSFNT